jgi:hypothetical protein
MDVASAGELGTQKSRHFTHGDFQPCSAGAVARESQNSRTKRMSQLWLHG